MLCKLRKGNFRVGCPLTGEIVIVKDIDNNAGIMPVLCPQPLFTLTNNIMVVSVEVDGPVKFYPGFDIFLEHGKGALAFHKISDEVAHHDLVMVLRKECVSQEVHRNKVIKYQG
jgi:hypothetical protein